MNADSAKLVNLFITAMSYGASYEGSFQSKRVENAERLAAEYIASLPAAAQTAESEQKPVAFNQAEFDEMTRKGAIAWEGVDPAKFIAELRGQSHDEDDARLHNAATALVAKLDVVRDDPQYQSVWILSANRGMPYTGPTYTIELQALRDALAANIALVAAETK